MKLPEERLLLTGNLSKAITLRLSIDGILSEGDAS